MMEKTKLGISIGLLGAGMYFAGLAGALPALLLAGYVLLREENSWLKRMAVKAAAIVLLMAVFPACWGLLEDIWMIVACMLGWVGLNVPHYLPLELGTILDSIVYFIGRGLLLWSGFCALSMGSVKTKKLDQLLDRHS